jgi:hypothetical protein
MEDERIETRWFTAREIEQGIQSGKIVDAKTMIGYCQWRRLGFKRTASALLHAFHRAEN